CVAPSVATRMEIDRPRWLRWLPESDLGSALMGAAVAPLALLPVGALGIYGLRQYGWGLFVGIPFAQGLFAVLLASVRRSRGPGECIAIAAGSVLVTGAIIFFAAWEGILCIAMAMPIAITLAMLGGIVGWGMVSAGAAGGHSAAGAAIAILIALPALIGAEYQAGPRPAVLPVHTSIDIDAPPEVVWRHVIAFAELPPPTETVFRLGIAYPTRARIEGTGVGAVRHCEFSTGAFVEPITVWDEPRRLEFDVVDQPRPMDEWSWKEHVEAPHLDDFLVSERGRFLLEPIEGGTRLTGTTWYRHNIWPEAYWRPWSDAVIHAIHRRVLGHIRNLARADTATGKLP
ncbi:MAG: SRPBCC family protein, partial [Deltaproteobacteria bacterium]|nr:SRPBCC family protein [Deltaproteobacteria bacterium]